MSLSDRIQVGYLIVVGLLLLTGLVSIIYTLPKVRPVWRGAYWMAILLNVSLMATFGLGAARMLGYTLPAGTVLWALEAAIAITAVEMILVPYIHRKEREIPGGPGTG